jgi:type IV secretory pathway TraG/TraD family ATPase VirD4
MIIAANENENNRSNTNSTKKINDFLARKKIREIPYWGKSGFSTFTSITSTAQPFFDDWTDPIIEKFLWSDPFKEPNDKFSLENSIKNKEIIFFSFPEKNISESHYRLGKILKSKYFSFSFSTYYFRKPKKIPVFYIADEFHRFITGDEESGEQSFLDRCRAYDVCCVMATQSVSSLIYGLQENTEPGSNIDNIMRIIVINSGTKFFFRTTDDKTNNLLKNLIPNNPYSNIGTSHHIIDIISLAMLDVGECYYLTPKGEWGRAKINVSNM